MRFCDHTKYPYTLTSFADLPEYTKYIELRKLKIYEDKFVDRETLTHNKRKYLKKNEGTIFIDRSGKIFVRRSNKFSTNDQKTYQNRKRSEYIMHSEDYCIIVL